MASIGAVDSGVLATALTRSSCSMPDPRTEPHACRPKYRKNVRSVSPGASGDLRNGGVLEPALAEESKGCLLESAVAVGLPTGHASIVLDDDSN